MSIKSCRENLIKYSCIICNYNTFDKRDYNKHLNTRKHKNLTLSETFSMSVNEIVSDNYNEKNNYFCEKCNYSCSNKANYNKHLSTNKHNNDDKNKNYICGVCNKEFILYNSFFKHKKTCHVLENKNELINELREPDIKKPEVTVELVLDLIKQNKELQSILIEQSKEHSKQIMELAKNQSVTNNNTNSNNTTNQQFNLQFFLNETCKDAMNITDFVNSLQLTTQDFENTGKVGFIEGITQIIINRMNSVDTTKRPMHCTDAKRETLYIKDDNVWEKEDDKKTKLRKVVNQVANKNLQQITKWKEEHPDFVTLDTQDNINFRKYYRVALGGETNEEDEKIFEKIKRNVLKEIVVDKSL